jgi:hypothetical protein
MSQAPLASEGLLISRRSIPRIIGTRGWNSTSSFQFRKLSSGGARKMDASGL